MAAEGVVAAEWLYGKMANDATLIALLGSGAAGVCQDVAREGTAFPYVIFHALDPGQVLDTAGTSQDVIWVESTWVVKAVAQTRSYGALGAIVQRIGELINKQSGTTDLVDGRVFSARRIRLIQYPETGPGGEQYRHLGGVWKIKSKVSQ